MESDRGSLPGTCHDKRRRPSARAATPLSGRDSLDSQKWRAMARSARTISQSDNLLETIGPLDRIGNLPSGVGAATRKARLAAQHRLGGSHRGRNLFAREKGGAEVSKTKKGKGTKLMLMVDANGIPLAIDVVSASAAEVNRIEPLLEERVLARQPERLMYDRAADSDPLRARLAERKIELICRYRRGRKKSPTQDGRAVGRLARRYRVERSISWLFNNRRLVVRYEYCQGLFRGFATLACVILILRTPNKTLYSACGSK